MEGFKGKECTIMSKISWLHISDLHIGKIGKTPHADTYNQQRVLEQFLTFVKNDWPEYIKKPDFAVITGDLVWSGTKNEYEDNKNFSATRFLKQLASDLGKDPGLFYAIVPGNHDTDRNKLLSVEQEKEHIEFAKDRNKINELFLAKTAPLFQRRKDILKRLEDYCNFVKQFHGNLKPDASREDYLWYKQNISVGSRTVHIIGLCSAWLCQSQWKGEGRETEGTDFLRMGEPKAISLFGNEQADLVLTLMHHDYDITADRYTKDLVETICGESHFILYGHEHEGKLLSPDITTKAHKFRAGTLFTARDYRNAFHLFEVDFSSGLGEVKLMTVCYEGEKWKVDRNVYQEKEVQAAGYGFDSKTGVMSFSLIRDPKVVSDTSRIGEIKDLQPAKVFISKLPVTGEKLFGREEEVKLLDEACDDEKCHIVSFVACGGVGKTAIVNTWLNQIEANHWRGARRVYGWSFYSQGTKEDMQASGDTFIAHALEWFGDKETAESMKSPWDKGVRLAGLVREEKTLLILDGLEPLQYPLGPMAGRLKDQGVQGLLRELCYGMDGLCIITTREKIKDIEGQVGYSVNLVELENLTSEVGREVLRNTGVNNGTDKELEQASKEFGGHALALTLLGTYLSVVHEGEIRKRDLVPALTEEEEQGDHAKRVMQSYEIWLKGTAELDILYLMGLFDRPAEMGAISVLKANPVIKGLTENLAGLNVAKWKYAVKHLRDLGLLAKNDDADVLDCHPLVREHFGEKLKLEKAEAWKEGHRKLYEYYKRLPEKELPDTLEEMEPLFRAVHHGCQAGKHQETFSMVYARRICRGDQYYIVKILGAFGSFLGALSCFFDEPWEKTNQGLKKKDKMFLLNQAGVALQSVGRLLEASEPMEAAVKSVVEWQDWKNAASGTSTLSELFLTFGDVKRAVEFGQKCVEYADRSGDVFERSNDRTTHANALHQAGRVDEAKRFFEEAEEMQRKNQPEYSYLYSIWGYRYCDLLLVLGQAEEVIKRAKKTLELAKMYLGKGLGLLDIAMDQLSLGRAHLEEYKKSKIKDKIVLEETRKWLDVAVAGLRESGNQDYLPRGLFARAEMFKETGKYKNAWRDLDEAREIAERGGMGLFLVDVLLVEGRLYLAQGQKAKANECGERAKKLIVETGYHRRDKEAEELCNC
jgi:tetratricopeptide (TPR) repeat protein